MLATVSETTNSPQNLSVSYTVMHLMEDTLCGVGVSTYMYVDTLTTRDHHSPQRLESKGGYALTEKVRQPAT